MDNRNIIEKWHDGEPIRSVDDLAALFDALTEQMTTEEVQG